MLQIFKVKASCDIGCQTGDDLLQPSAVYAGCVMAVRQGTTAQCLPDCHCDHRYTIEELESFVTDAIHSIPGTSEAIADARDRRVNPVQSACLNSA